MNKTLHILTLKNKNSFTFDLAKRCPVLFRLFTYFFVQALIKVPYKAEVPCRTTCVEHFANVDPSGFCTLTHKQNICSRYLLARG